MRYSNLVLLLSTVSAVCKLHDGTEFQANQGSYVLGELGQRGSIHAKCDAAGETLTCTEYQGRTDDFKNPEVPCSVLADEQDRRRRLGVLLVQGQQSWPNNAMCYRDPSALLTPEQLATFNLAVAEYNTKTALRVLSLTECAAQPDAETICGGCLNALTVSQTSGCSSFIGYINQVSQDISLAPECFLDRPSQPGADASNRVPSPNSIIHELGHAAGLHHEQQHVNRLVAVIPGSLTATPENYQLIPTAATTAYDPLSIMHFSLATDLCIPISPTYDGVKFCDVNEAAGTNGCQIATEAVCDRGHVLQGVVGGSVVLGAGDVTSINTLYPVAAAPAGAAAPGAYGTPVVAPAPAPAGGAYGTPVVAPTAPAPAGGTYGTAVEPAATEAPVTTAPAGGQYCR